jgi:hypothetical protein
MFVSAEVIQSRIDKQTLKIQPRRRKLGGGLPQIVLRLPRLSTKADVGLETLGQDHKE